MKKKISIIGSCPSRDLFNKMFVTNWRDFFEVVIERFQTSFISVMSVPIPVNRNTKSKEINKNYYSKYFYAECEKSIINGLVSTQPDVILVDFYADAVYGVQKISDKQFITKDPGHWDDLFGCISLGPKEKIIALYRPEEYLILFKKAFRKFVKLINDYLPSAQIIVNELHLANKIKLENSIEEFKFTDVNGVDSAGKKVMIKGEDRYNIYCNIIGEMNKFAIQELGLTSIKGKRDYYINPNHSWGPGMVHYEKEFYIDVFKDLINKSRECVSKLNNENLFTNGYFKQNTLFWDAWNKNFSIKNILGNNQRVLVYDGRKKAQSKILCDG